MDGHLVTVKVSVETFADQRVQVNRVAFDQCRFERLDSHSVQRRSTVQKHRVIANHLLQDIPNFFVLALKHFLGGLDRVGVTEFFQATNDERLVQFQRDLLWQTALVQFQSRSNNDDRASGVVDSFAKQVFAETTLLSFDHVGQRFQRSVG